MTRAHAGSTPLQLRRAPLDNLGRLVGLMEAAFGSAPGPDYFDWKYAQNPFGQMVGFEALDGSTPVAFYCVIPQVFSIGGDPVGVFQSVDTMTDPGYRGRGLFVQLATLTYDEVSRIDPGRTLIGIAGESSLPGFVRRLGWRHIHDIRLYFAERRLVSLRRLGSRTRRIQAGLASEVAQLGDYLDHRRRITGQIGLHLSPEFLGWRVLRHPEIDYRIALLRDRDAVLGFCIYSLDDKGRCLLSLVDLPEQRLDHQHLGELLRFVFQETGARLVYTWEPTSISLRRAYRRLGFLSNRLSRGPGSERQPFIVRGSDDFRYGLDWSNPHNFDLQPLMKD